jgi:hypothetical protein
MSANQCALLDCCNERRPLFTAGDVLGFQRKTHTHTSFAYSHSLSPSRIIILSAPLSFPARTPVFTQCLLLIDFQKIK